jgi:hypothetical protein
MNRIPTRQHLVHTFAGMLVLPLTLFASTAIAQNNSDLQVQMVPPASTIMVLPNEPVTHGWQSDQINIVACRGEFEPASFVITPNRDIDELRITAGPLTGPGGSIAESNVDIKYVKCWYQGSGAWKNIDDDGETRVLTPELLLNDDQLIKVDYEAKTNHMRGFAASPRAYRNVSEAKPNFKADPSEAFPVRDARKLQPTSLPAEQNKQIWLTVRVPDDAKPGLYTGQIQIHQGTQPLATLTLNLRVLPFDLLPPYYLTSIFHRNPSPFRGLRAYDAEIKNLVAHGVASPLMYGSTLAQQKIRQRYGIAKGPFLGIYGDSSSPQAARAEVEKMKAFGYSDVYFNSIDEASGDRLLSQIPQWQNAHAGGALNFATGGRYNYFDQVGEYVDMFICSGQPTPEEAAKWHSIGHKVLSYAHPFCGVEDPELFRRTQGLVHWAANYDGFCNYAYIHAFGGAYNDFDGRDLCMAYPTAEGVIDTIAWEGMREGVDDVRYVNTLEAAIEKANSSGDERQRQLAAAAEQYLADLNVEERNLDTVRLEVINHLLKLHGAE